MARCVIFDLDNCVADDGWRIPRINWQKHGDARYEDYHMLAPFDQMENRSLIDTHRCLGEKIVFMTARPVLYAAPTEHWLKLNGQHEFTMLMRNNGDIRSSPEVKQQQLVWLTTHYGFALKDIIAAYDDHQGVVDMYLKHGIPARRLAIHTVDAFHDPIRNIPAH
jgi:hypothetical protein